MRKTKILTVLGVLLAMSVTACGKKTESSSDVKSSQPVSSSQAPASSSPAPASSSQAPASSATSSEVAPVESSPPSEATTSQSEFDSGFSSGSNVHTHVWDEEYDVIKAATCLEEGEAKYYCECGETEIRAIPALGHDWDEGVVTTAATCKNKGVKTFTCKREGCGATKTEDIDALGGNHEWDDGVVTLEPTCTAQGEKTLTCTKCGETKTEKIKANGHSWSEWTPKEGEVASCTADGKEVRTCSACGETEEQVVKAAHKWGEEQAVDAGADPADQVGYKLATCQNNDAIKVDLRAVDAKFYKGKIKSGTPEGYFKLNSTNDKAYWKFTLAGTSLYKGMLYEIGAMDSFSSNTERSYAQTSTSGDHAPKYPKGNFDAVVNGVSCDKSQWIDIPFSELLAEGEDSSAMGDNYSPLCLCPIGEAVLQPGLNEITYERLGSYNLIISDLVFIGSEYQHEHAPATTWSSDDTQHWHACTAVGCPTNKLDVANHEFGEWETTKEATCSAEGERQHTCTICGKVVKEAIAKIAHTYANEGAYTVTKPATCTAVGEQERECTVCHEKDVQPIAKLAHDFSGGVAQKYAAGEGYIATEASNCELCGLSTLEWSAVDYDLEKSTAASEEGKLPKLTDSDKAVDFDDSSAQYDNKDETKKGTHIVYNINVPAAVEGAGLEVKATKSQWISEPFDRQSNDGRKGWELINEEWVQPESRYGLKVDGQLYMIGKNNGAIKAESTAKWMAFPDISLNLTAGIHEIEFFKYGGYGVNHYAFRLTGLPHVEPAHTHTLSDWQSDDNNHWKICTGEGCLDPEGTKYQNDAHEWGDVVVSTPATHTTAGAGTKTCAVCGKVVDVVIPKVAHDWVDGDAVANSDSKNVIPMTCSCGKVGAKISENDYSSGEFSSGDDAADALRPKQGKAIVYKVVVSKAGNYSLEFGMFCKTNDTVAMSQRGFTVKVNGEAATVTLDGTTTPKALGMTSTNAVQVELCASIPLIEGENTIEITCASYRLHYKGNLIVAEL